MKHEYHIWDEDGLEEYDEDEAFLDHEDFMWHLEREEGKR